MIWNRGGTFANDDPTFRTGLVKGVGTAKEITIPLAYVAALNGQFHPDDVQPQSHIHPKR